MSEHPKSDWRPVSLPGAACTTIHSAEGVAYTLSLCTPEAPAPAPGFPLLLVLDGADHFIPYAAIARRLARRTDATGVPLAIIAAIESDEPQTRRYINYTPWPPADPADTPAMPFGGADAFAEFLQDRVLSEISHVGAVDASRIALAGHSLSAYFALYAASRIAAISSFGAISPSIWWNEARLLEALAKADVSGKRFFIAIGDRETHPTRRMIQRARGLADELASVARETRFMLAPDEDHGSTPYAVAPALLRAALRGS